MLENSSTSCCAKSRCWARRNAVLRRLSLLVRLTLLDHKIRNQQEHNLQKRFCSTKSVLSKVFHECRTRPDRKEGRIPEQPRNIKNYGETSLSPNVRNIQVAKNRDDMQTIWFEKDKLFLSRLRTRATRQTNYAAWHNIKQSGNGYNSSSWAFLKISEPITDMSRNQYPTSCLFCHKNYRGPMTWLLAVPLRDSSQH